MNDLNIAPVDFGMGDIDLDLAAFDIGGRGRTSIGMLAKRDNLR